MQRGRIIRRTATSPMQVPSDPKAWIGPEGAANADRPPACGRLPKAGKCGRKMVAGLTRSQTPLSHRKLCRARANTDCIPYTVGCSSNVETTSSLLFFVPPVGSIFSGGKWDDQLSTGPWPLSFGEGPMRSPTIFPFRNWLKIGVWPPPLLAHRLCS